MGLKPIIASAALAVREPNAVITDYRDRSAIAGSAAVIGDPLSGPAGKMPRRQSWQEEIWQFNDNVGELWHTGDWIGNAFSKIRLRPGYIGVDGQIGPIYDNNGKALVDDAEMADEIIRMLVAPLGGQAQLMRTMGQNIALVGEFYLVGTDTFDARGSFVCRTFEALSTDEIRGSIGGRGWTRHRGNGEPPEEVPAGTFVLRVWNPHPRHSSQANSGFRAQLEILEEIVLLTRQVRSAVISKLVQAGIYWVPEEMSFPLPPGADPNDEPFTTQLLETAAAAISDRGSAAAAVPMVVRAPARYIAAVVHHSFQAPDDAISVLKRTEAIQRFAQGAPLPVETNLGHASTTFDNARQISESEFVNYIEPMLSVPLDAITARILRPMMMVARGLPPESAMPDDIRRFVVWYDESALVLPKDMSATAILAFDRQAITPSGLRHYLGIPEGFGPDDDELDAMISVKQRLNVKETVREDAAPGGVAPSNATAPPPAPGVVGSVNGNGHTNGRLPVPDTTLANRCAMASEMFVHLAVERTGALLKQKANGKAGVPPVKDTPNLLVAHTLGPRAVVDLIGDPVPLLARSFPAMRSMVLMWAVQAGVADPDTLADAMMTAAEATAKRRLYDPGALIDWTKIQELAGANA